MTGHRTRTWELRITRERAGSVLILATSGRIGEADVPGFRVALTEALRDADAVIVDLSEVDYLSAGGGAALHEASVCSAGKATVLVCGIQEPVRIALELAGVLDTLRVEPTRAESLATASRPRS